MKSYLLIRSGANTSATPLPLDGSIREVYSAEAAVSIMESGELLSAVLIDTPSGIPGIEN